MQLEDEDEFEQHRVELAYPDHVITHARETASRVLADVAAGAAPFDRVAAEGWALRREG